MITKFFTHSNHDFTHMGWADGWLGRILWCITPPMLVVHLCQAKWSHYSEVVMGVMASKITSLKIVYSTIYGHRSKKTSKLHVTGLCPVISPHKWPVTRKMFPFDDVIMIDVSACCLLKWSHYLEQFELIIYLPHTKHFQLTHCGLVTPYGDTDLGQHRLR